MGDSRLRLFVGVELDAQARAAIEGALQAGVDSAPSDTRWLAPENWHFTLQFLGGVDAELAPRVAEACRETATHIAAFEIELGGFGAFKSPRAARVVWLGVTRGIERLASLYDALLARTEPLGFAREARPFAAHLTVARFKQPANVTAWLPKLNPPALRMQVARLTLFRSHLSPKGARYEALERYALAG